MRMFLLATLSAVILSGCLGAGPRGGDNAPDAVYRDPVEWTYDCPPDPVRMSAPDVCVQTLGGPESFTGEPHIAIHPTNSQIMAVGVNRIGAYVGTPAFEAGGVSNPGLTLGLFVTEDGGLSWRTPAVPVSAGMIHVGDPNLAFDLHGALHVTGLTNAATEIAIGAATGSAGEPTGAFHVKTADLGLSWSAIAIVSDERGADRQWITIEGDDVFITYQKSSIPGSFIARSNDLGTTWQSPLMVSPCNLNSEVVVSGDRLIMACTDAEGGRVRIVDVAGAEPVDLASFPGFYGYKRLAVTQDGTLILVMSGYSATAYATIVVYSSEDGGDTWRPLADVGPLTDTMAGWNWSWVSWATVDGQDRLHVLATGGAGQECVRGACEDEASSRVHVHIILDTVTAHLEHAVRVSPMNRDDGGRQVDSPWAGYGDEASGIACSSDACVLAWGWDKSVDWTIIRPS